MFGIQSFAEVEAKARQVLREKGFSDELIEAQLARGSREYRDWPLEWPTGEAGQADKR